VNKFLQIFLGVLTAFGGFVDIGDLVANGTTGSRFGLRLAWVVAVGVVGIVLYAEMSGRVAAISGRPVFDIIRERLGVRLALANLGASFFINILTLTAELAGLALIVELVTGLNYLFWIPLAAIVVWLVLWKMSYSMIEHLFGLTGLFLVVFAVALWKLHPDPGNVIHAVTHPHVPSSENMFTYWYFAIGLLGAAMTPYEVFFFSSGAVEDGWTKTDLNINRANVYLGFPLGGILSLAIMACSALVFMPKGIEVGALSQITLPVGLTLGKVGVAALLLGMFAAIFSAAIETALSAGYTVSQYFGWQWGKFVKPRQASNFQVIVIASILVSVALALTTIDPIKVTEYSIVLAAAALPLTYFPILVVANDRDYMGDKVNSRPLNVVAFAYLVLLLAVAVATIPLMIITKGGA
jgi:Mn2+/Fe2+ NRAMP family transporter